MMDVANPERARARRQRRRWTIAVALAAAVFLTLFLTRLEPAVPTLERQALLVDTVRRGEMLRKVRGPGSLTPIESRLISAPSEAQVERLAAEAGARVSADTVLLELSNPVIGQSVLEARARLAEAQADYARLSAQLDSDLVALDGQLASAESEAEQARLQAEADARLAEKGLIPDLNHQLSSTRAEELAQRAELARRRAAKGRESAAAQLAAEQARVDQARDQAALREAQAAALQVRAGIDGVLQRVEVEVGERVVAGTELARVAQPEQLKAVLRIPATQANDVALGQPVEIDTRNGVVDGRVARIDPAVRDGTVTVDVELTGELPEGARPDLSVDGTIEIDRLEDTLHVGRPAYAQPDRLLSVFRLADDEGHAERVSVRVGRASVDSIEIVEGLAEGDRIILSDTRAWEEHDRVRVD